MLKTEAVCAGVTLILWCCCPLGAEEPFRMADCPSISGGDYRPDRLVRAANLLIGMGADKAHAVLLSEAQKFLDGGGPSSARRDERIFLLCTFLYRADAPKPLRGPGLGAPIVSLQLADWPCQPLALVDGVPLLVAWWGHLVAGGGRETGAEYLEYCKANGVFRKTPYEVPSKAEVLAAAAKLVSSPAWKRIQWPSPYFEKQTKSRLLKQVDDMPERRQEEPANQPAAGDGK